MQPTFWRPTRDPYCALVSHATCLSSFYPAVKFTQLYSLIQLTFYQDLPATAFASNSREDLQRRIAEWQNCRTVLAELSLQKRAEFDLSQLHDVPAGRNSSSQLPGTRRRPSWLPILPSSDRISSWPVTTADSRQLTDGQLTDGQRTADS